MSAEAVLYRLSGGGNDFLALAEPAQTPDASRIRSWCTRGLSLGADGLFVLRPITDGAVAMEYYNADGHAARLCLNGTRCAARLAFELGWARDRVEIETAAGRIRGEAVDDDGVALEVTAPSESPRPCAPRVDDRAWEGYLLTVGVPVFVLPWPEPLAGAPVDRLGPALRSHAELGDAGANVMFTRFLEPDRLQIRSYERGVEAETLACGTGVLAACAVAWNRGFDRRLRVLTGGGCELEVERSTRGDRWRLTGDARLLARLQPAAGAERLPEPPKWS